MKETIIAKRYAQAFFEHAKNKKKLNELESDLIELSNLFDESVEFQNFITNPTIESDDRQNILDQLFSKKINALTLQLLKFLDTKKRLDLLKNISTEFQKLYLADNQTERIQITSSIDLTKTQINRIEEKWSKKLNKKIQSHLDVDDQLLGGLKITIGDQIHDYTIDSKLKRFKESIV